MPASTVLESYLILFRTRLCLSAFNRQHFGGAVDQPSVKKQGSQRVDEQQTIDMAIQSLKRAERWMPLRVTCLQRAATLQQLLRLRGIETRMQIGVKNRSGQLQAHAWIEYEGHILNDIPANCSQYQPLETTQGETIYFR
jgi:hypothetical protein